MSKEIYIFSSVTIVSIILHLSVLSGIYCPGNFINMPLTAGMIFSWLFASSIIKDIKSADSDITFKDIFNKIPFGLKVMVVTSMTYAIINFILNLSVNESDGWLEFNLSPQKMAGVTGFWIFFYIVGLGAAWIKNFYVIKSVSNE